MPSRPLSILIVEDQEDDAALVVLELKRGGLTVSPRRVETKDEMRAALAERPWDLILTDYSLPGFGAMEALTISRQADPDVPVIVVSGTIGEDLAVEIMRAGACDYLLKQNLRRLVPAIDRELREAENRRAHRRSEAALRSSEARFRALIEKSFDAVLLLDANGVMLYGTSAVERITGWSLADLIGRNLSAWKHPAEVMQHAAALQELSGCPGESYTRESRIRHRDGSWRWLESTFTNLLADPAVQAIVVNFRDITDRKRVEVAVARDALLLANVRDSIIVVDLNGIVTYWNAGASRLYGWTAEEMIGRPALERYPEPMRSQVGDLLADMMRGNEFSGEWEDTRKDGSKIWIEARIGLLRDSEGRRVGLLGISRDISDRKRAEADRDRILGQLRLQIERMPLGYILVDPQGGVLDWNPMAERIFGFTRQEVLGRKLSAIGVLTPEGSRMGSEILEQARAGNVAPHWIGENLTRDGRTITCEWFSTLLTAAGGGTLGIFSLVQDITTRRESEASLRLHDRAIQAVTQGILITDPTLPDNPIVFASPGFERLTGYSAVEVTGRNCRFLQGKDTAQEEVARLRRAVQEGSPCTCELLNYKKDGTPFWNELSISPVRDAEGHLTHFVGVQTDVSQRRQLEANYRHAQKMEAIGLLAGGVAHDFNNLLTIISGYSDMLLYKLASDDPNRSSIEEIHRAGKHAASLTRQLLVFSRKQVTASRLFDLNALVSDTEKMLQRVIGEDIRLTSVLRPLSGLVKGDPGQLEQVLLNLAVNARDAMPQGGRLTLETSDIELDDRTARLHPDLRPGPYILLAVSDTGCGMSAEVQARIFEPFFTTKAMGQGTGLGLSVVHGIVKQAGGHVDVSSTLGAGATFKVYLPRAARELQTPAPGLRRLLSSQGSETILLVEDDPVVRAFSRQILSACGYTILMAADADAALRTAAEHQRPIHLLVTDVVMPGLSGRQLAERLLQLRPDTKVLYLSGYTDDAIVRHGILQDQVQFLQKPFGPAALASKVREVLDQPTDKQTRI